MVGVVSSKTRTQATHKTEPRAPARAGHPGSGAACRRAWSQEGQWGRRSKRRCRTPQAPRESTWAPVCGPEGNTQLLAPRFLCVSWDPMGHLHHPSPESTERWLLGRTLMLANSRSFISITHIPAQRQHPVPVSRAPPRLFPTPFHPSFLGLCSQGSPDRTWPPLRYRAHGGATSRRSLYLPGLALLP